MNTPLVFPTVSRRRFLGQLSTAGVLALAPRSLLALDPARRKLGVALVGLGGYSSGQLGPALKLTEHCRLAGVVTSSREKGARWAKDHGFPETSIYGYDTMARMADNPDIDIVYVVTPNGLHAEHAIAAAKAGKHVICEKPMANTVADCDAIIAACRAAGVKLSIGYRLHFDPFHEELRRLVRTQEFGPFMKMDGGFGFTMSRPQWRAEKKLAGGGPLMDLGVYVIQETFMAAGAAPVAITARELPKKRPEFFRDVEVLNLDSPLHKPRSRHLAKIGVQHAVCIRWTESTDPEKRHSATISRKFIEKALRPEKPYSAMVAAYLEAHPLPDLPA